MMNSAWFEELELLSRETPKGCLVKKGASLARCSTLRIGGPAEALVDVGDMGTLQRILEMCSRHRVSLVFIGRGANVLFPDAGLRGVVCRLKGDFAEFQIADRRVTSGAGVLMAKLARACATRGLVGLEGLAGFPASVGGAVVMNAGCYGTEVSDWLVDVDVLEPSLPQPSAGNASPGKSSVDSALPGTVPPGTVSSETDGWAWSLRKLGVDELEPGYRTTSLKGGTAVVVSARFELDRGDSDAALQRLETLNRRRWASLPSGKPNAGSIFRNPADDFAGRLLDEAGVKGLQVGGAAFSKKHANVIINLGEAKAVDVLELIRIARGRVLASAGVQLELELLVLGDHGSRFGRR